MFRSILSIAKPVQLMSRQLLNKPFTPVLPILMNRCFSESVKPEETVEKETGNDVAEEVKEQVIHNQFSHVILLDFMSFMIQKNSLLFEHTKENEPKTVGEDDWFAIVQLSGTQYKLGKVYFFM